MKKRSNLKKDDLLSGKGQRLWKRAKKIIPGGNQLLSKRAEMFLMAVGACALGYADFDVNKAVANVVRRGSISTLNAPEEVELAELLCSIHPWAHMVRYARAGGESMAIAARIARAYTGRDIIAFCGYHGWADLYLATNLKDPNGLND